MKCFLSIALAASLWGNWHLWDLLQDTRTEFQDTKTDNLNQFRNYLLKLAHTRKSIANIWQAKDDPNLHRIIQEAYEQHIPSGQKEPIGLDYSLPQVEAPQEVIRVEEVEIVPLY